MPFEVFDKSKALYGRSPNVTIQAPRGLISINQSAYHRIGRPEFVDLMFDGDERLIAIRPGNEETGHRVRVADQPGSPAVISGTAFTKYYDINTEQTRRWEPSFDGQMLIIDLKQPPKPAGQRRNTTDEDGDDDDLD